MVPNIAILHDGFAENKQEVPQREGSLTVDTAQCTW